MNKIRAGFVDYNGVLIPDKVVVKRNKKGLEVYISGISKDRITFKEIHTGNFYSVPFSFKILDLFLNKDQ